MKQYNVTIVGFGNVGSSLCNILLQNKSHSWCINVMDPSPDIAGDWEDTCHAAALRRDVSMRLNDEHLFADADFVLLTAGANPKHGASRSTVAKENIQLCYEIFRDVKFKRTPYIIVVSNPVDLMGWHTWKATGLPASRVLTTSTMLDTYRMQHHLAELLSVPPSDVVGFVLGEHGTTMVPIYSQTKIKDEPFDWLLTGEIRKQCTELVRTAAYRIRKTSEATRFGVNACVMAIMDALLGGEPMVTALGVHIDHQYAEMLGVKDIFLGLPVVLSAGGYAVIDFLELQPDEQEALRESAGCINAALHRTQAPSADLAGGLCGKAPAVRG